MQILDNEHRTIVRTLANQSKRICHISMNILPTSDGSVTNSKIANHFGTESERIAFEHPPTLYSSFTKRLEYFCNTPLFLFHIWMNI